MTLRLHHIKITNFKAFRHFELPLGGRHLLVYGANGSGKSSLYWALYTFLQSAQKEEREIAKYFDPGHAENLLNLDEQAAPNHKVGEILTTLRGDEGKTTWRINRAGHGTFNEPTILKCNLASDFISYRFLYGFSNFRNSQELDFWPLFEKEILPFCVSTSGQLPERMWQKIATGTPNPSGVGGKAGRLHYERFIQNTEAFATVLDEVVDVIRREAQKFYDRYFQNEGTPHLTLQLKVLERPTAEGTTRPTFVFRRPRIGFGVKIGETPIQRTQSFLNEARLTQLALSVRFGATLSNLHDSPLKLLVLDDLLVSLDMSNRMRVVDLLLSETFASYQKVFFTHDLGFFREFRRRIGDEHKNWRMMELALDVQAGVKACTKKTDLQKAQDYLAGHDLEEAAMCLRKAAEHSAKRYREQVEGTALPPGKFISLSNNLRAAKNHLLGRLPRDLYEEVIEGTPEDLRALLVPASDTDVSQSDILSAEERDMLKRQRDKLREVLNDGAWQAIDQIRLLDRLLRFTERVLNPASHGNDVPHYEAEVRDAMRCVEQLIAGIGSSSAS